MNRLRRADTILPVVVTGLFALLSLGGCASQSQAGPMMFSPDGRTVAFAWSSTWVALMPDTPRAEQSLYLRWCSADAPRIQHSVRIDRLGPSWGAITLAEHVRPAFSRDSRCLAVLGPRGLSVVDLAGESACCITPENEVVSSFAWVGCGDDEIAYVSSAVPGDWKTLTGAKVQKRTVWRQKLVSRGQSLPERRQVYAFDGQDESAMQVFLLGRLGHYWSPDGRFLVFMPYPVSSQWRVLDLASGQVRAFGQTFADAIGVSWKLDSSEALCLSRIGGNGPVQAILLETEPWRATNLSRQFAENFSDSKVVLWPCWTDAGWVLVNHTSGGGCLVRPQPWGVVAVGDEVARLSDPINVLRCAELRPLGRTGRLIAHTPDGDWHAVDSSGRLMGDMGSFADRFAISPDGVLLAELDAGGCVSVRRLVLPTTMPASAAMPLEAPFAPPGSLVDLLPSVPAAGAAPSPLSVPATTEPAILLDDLPAAAPSALPLAASAATTRPAAK